MGVIAVAVAVAVAYGSSPSHQQDRSCGGMLQPCSRHVPRSSARGWGLEGIAKPAELLKSSASRLKGSPICSLRAGPTTKGVRVQIRKLRGGGRYINKSSPCIPASINKATQRRHGAGSPDFGDLSRAGIRMKFIGATALGVAIVCRKKGFSNRARENNKCFRKDSRRKARRKTPSILLS